MHHRHVARPGIAADVGRLHDGHRRLVPVRDHVGTGGWCHGNREADGHCRDTSRNRKRHRHEYLLACAGGRMRLFEWVPHADALSTSTKSRGIHIAALTGDRKACQQPRHGRRLGGTAQKKLRQTLSAAEAPSVLIATQVGGAGPTVALAIEQLQLDHRMATDGPEPPERHTFDNGCRGPKSRRFCRTRIPGTSAIGACRIAWLPSDVRLSIASRCVTSFSLFQHPSPATIGGTAEPAERQVATCIAPLHPKQSVWSRALPNLLQSSVGYGTKSNASAGCRPGLSRRCANSVSSLFGWRGISVVLS